METHWAQECPGVPLKHSLSTSASAAAKVCGQTKCTCSCKRISSEILLYRPLFKHMRFLAIIEGANANFMNLLSGSHHSLGLRHLHRSIDILSPRMPQSLNWNILWAQLPQQPQKTVEKKCSCSCKRISTEKTKKIIQIHKFVQILPDNSSPLFAFQTYFFLAIIEGASAHLMTLFSWSVSSLGPGHLYDFMLQNRKCSKVPYEISMSVMGIRITNVPDHRNPSWRLYSQVTPGDVSKQHVLSWNSDNIWDWLELSL